MHRKQEGMSVSGGGGLELECTKKVLMFCCCILRKRQAHTHRLKDVKREKQDLDEKHNFVACWLRLCFHHDGILGLCVCVLRERHVAGDNNRRVHPHT
jgi:hypothetical protein